MKAFLLDGLRQLVISRFGEVAGAWVDEAVKKKTPSAEELTECYVDTVRSFLGLSSKADVLELFGEFWVSRLMNTTKRDSHGPDGVIAAIQDYNNVHEKLLKEYAGVHFPIFRTEMSGADVGVHYDENDSYPVDVVRGILRAICNEFSPPCDLREGGDASFYVRARRKSAVDLERLFASQFLIAGADVDKIFPYHLAFDRSLIVVQAGSKLVRICPALAIGAPLTSQFRLDNPPDMTLKAEELLENPDVLYALTSTLPDQDTITLHGQIAYFASSSLFVFLGTPTLRSLRTTGHTFLDIPVLNRMTDVPFNFNITQVALDNSQTLTRGDQTMLQLPSRAAKRSASAADKNIMLLRIEKSDSMPTAKEGVDITSPVQKLLNALQSLREAVPPDARAQIDSLMRELTQAPDVYLPSLAGRLMKQDKEVNSYMASFFPRQSTVKFNIQPRINRSVSMAGRRANTLISHRSTGLANMPQSPRMTLANPAGREGGLPVCTVSSMPNPTKAGWLNKESSKNARSWRLRYFILNGQYLYYYRSDSPDATPLGIVNLAEYNIINKVTRKSAICLQLAMAAPPAAPERAPGSGDEEQSLDDDGRKYFLYADDPAETKAWMDAIADTYAELKLGADAQAWHRLMEESERVDVATPGDSPAKSRSRSIVDTEAVRIAIPRQSLGQEVEWLRRLDQLDFNVFELAAVTNDRPLQFLAKAVLIRTGILDKMNVPEHKLDNFLRVINRGYRKENSYHNNYHAADVTQTLYYFLYTLGVAQYLGDREIFAALLAAIIHDFMHPGVNNAYMINKRAPEAMLYNDQSVLENMHLTKAFQVLADDDCNILCNLRDDDYRHVRMLVIQMVLNTDMSQHFELMGKFKSAVMLMADKPAAEIQPTTIMLILSMAIHCADVSNPCKPMHMYQEWAKRVMNEFWNQGDLERDANVPISPMCDRNTITLEKCQSSFMDFIVEPLYMTFAELVPELHDDCIANLLTNKAYFQGLLKQADSPPAEDAQHHE